MWKGNHTSSTSFWCQFMTLLCTKSDHLLQHYLYRQTVASHQGFKQGTFSALPKDMWNGMSGFLHAKQLSSWLSSAHTPPSANIYGIPNIYGNISSRPDPDLLSFIMHLMLHQVPARTTDCIYWLLGMFSLFLLGFMLFCSFRLYWFVQLGSWHQALCIPDSWGWGVNWLAVLLCWK